MGRFSFDAIGTHWQIDLDEATDAALVRELEAAIAKRIEQFDHDYSRFRPDSLVTAWAKAAGAYPLPEDAGPLFSLYEKMYQVTDGAVTPLIGQVLSDAGYDATYSLLEKELHRPPAWEDVIVYTPTTLTLKRPALLDFGAAGKGYIIDMVASLIEAAGVDSFTVDAGGDICHRDRGDQPLRVGLEHPGDTSQVIGVVNLGNESLCGSAGNRRAWGNFHHIIDPHTLQSPRDIIAAWATAETTMVADAMTTGLFFVPSTVLAKHFDFEYLILRSDFTVDRSNHFPAEVFVQ